MGTFTDYLKFTDKLDYRDKQVSVINEISLTEDEKEVLSNIGTPLKMLVFAHPECPDCMRVIGVLEALRKYIPSLEIDYRKRSEDKELLLKYSPDGRIPTLFLIDGIKVTTILSEFPKKLKEDMKLNLGARMSFHKGCYDGYVIKDILEKIL